MLEKGENIPKIKLRYHKKHALLRLARRVSQQQLQKDAVSSSSKSTFIKKITRPFSELATSSGRSFITHSRASH